MTKPAFAAVAALVALAPFLAKAAPEDAYGPLKLYEGKWLVTEAGGSQPLRVDNHCARTGLFFACEQVVGDKTAALLVFLPTGRTGAGETYRTQALRADATAPGPWYHLTIDGDRWVYAQDAKPEGKGPFKRTLNLFAGPDHIAFEIQSSADGKAWTTVSRGQEQRAP